MLKTTLTLLVLGWSLHLLHVISYRVLKSRIVKRQSWDLNICCGLTDGGGVNADIVAHADLPKLVVVDVEHLPFKDDAFESVLSSHTLEHVPDPDAVYQELIRVGEAVTIVIPPLWDVLAIFNFWEHRWVYLTFSKEHQSLPPRVPLPFASQIQSQLGQVVRG